MQTIQAGARGLGLLMSLNWDRVLALLVLAGSLALGAHLHAF